MNSIWLKIKSGLKKTWKWIVGIFVVGALAMNIPPQGAINDDLIKYPAEVDTDIEKLEFSSRAEEVLRLEHNVVGARFRDGEITLAQWNNYLRDEFDLKSRKISGEKARILYRLGVDSLAEIEPRMAEFEGYRKSTKYQINTDTITK